MSSVPNNVQCLNAPSGRHGTVFQCVYHNLSLPFIQLRFYRPGHQKPILRHPQALDVIARTGECNLEVTRIGAEEWWIQPVVEHLVVHPAEAAAAFLNSVKV